jgi:hypothetical protein
MAKLLAQLSVVVGAWFLMTPSFGMANQPATTLTTNPPTASLLSRCQYVPPNAAQRAVEVLEGEAALAHIRNLKAKRPKAWARAEQLLIERGYKPTGEAVVLRSTSLVRDREKPRKPFGFIQETIQDSSGEVTFWSWDDGQDGTWEGTIYMADYDGFESLADAQIYFDTPDFAPTWEYTVHVEGPPQEYHRDAWLGRSSPVKLASFKPGIFSRVQCATRLVQDWSWCAAPGCGWTLYDCAKIRYLRGPAFAYCAKVGCGAIAIGCAGPALYNAWQCSR